MSDAPHESLPESLPEVPLPTEIREFLVHLEKGRDLSPNTRAAYTRDLREFSTWLAQLHGA
ncbi:MAG: site-specific integrase, partial [Gemmatimonas sp.]|nr:site-specific integrase [Gemmatimonas sp.]